MGYTYGIRWTDDLIRQKILEVKNALSLDRMPSRSECVSYFHDEALVNAISRRKKWYELANELGLKIKESETFFGKSQESNAAEILISHGFSVRKMSQNFAYDLLVDDCVKVDVKASHLYKSKNGNFYTFNIGKEYATCDFYMLFAFGEDDEKDIYIVPSNIVIAQNQISMGQISSKYHRFKNRWDLISSLSDFWSNLLNTKF